jgi:hypothetical protein
LDGVPGRAPLSGTLRGKWKTHLCRAPQRPKTKRSNRNRVLDCGLAAVDVVLGRRALKQTQHEIRDASEKGNWRNRSAQIRLRRIEPNKNSQRKNIWRQKPKSKAAVGKLRNFRSDSKESKRETHSTHEMKIWFFH